MAFQVFDQRVIHNVSCRILNSFGTNNYPFAFGGTYGSVVTGLALTNSDVIDHTCVFTSNDGSADVAVASIVVPAGAGGGVLPAVDGFGTQWPTSFDPWLLASGSQASVHLEVAVTTDPFLVGVGVVFGDF